MKRVIQVLTLSAVSAAAVFVLSTFSPAQSGPNKYDPTAAALADIAKMNVGDHDWPQWGGWNGRNNTPDGKNIPVTWDVGEIDEKTGKWINRKNIKWSAKLGSQTYGNPVVANGKVYVGTNNGAGYLKRFPPRVDLGCLLCFDEKTGEFLWQHSSPKLAAGRVNDWPEQGICDAPYVDGGRLWFVTSRGEVVCLDTNGFLDGQNDGPFKTEQNENKDEADVVWKYDMMARQGLFQHNMCSCSVTCWREKGILFVNTSNGVDASHINLPYPDAPSFMAMDRETGTVLWTDKSPGLNILHGQWSSPTFSVIGGQAQVLFAGGDGWLYSFDPEGDGKGNSKLLWKFDCNPKASIWILGGRGTRNNLIATPVVYDGLVYIAVGQDPEHSTGMGHVWCIDPTKRGDVSPTLAVDKNGNAVPHRRLKAIETKNGEKAISNPKSAVVWHYGAMTQQQYDNQQFEHQMHRSCGTVAIKNDLLYIADFAGLVTCLNAKTGKRNWSFDMFTQSWGTPLIVEDHVYIGDEQGDVFVFPLTGNPNAALKMVNGQPQPSLGSVYMGSAVYSTPVIANNVMFISNKNTLFAISPGGK
jgi:outer membrane protein assembly factor BamB